MLEKIKNIYGLSKIPFTKEITVNEIFNSNSMNEACARFEAALQSEDIALLSGAAGTGKSCILRKLKSVVDESRYRVLYIAGGFRKTSEIVKYILHLMNEPVPFHGSKAIRELKAAVERSNTMQNIKPVLIIDEAQELPDATLSDLKSLLNYKMDSQNYLFMLLCGQPELNFKLKLSSLESLNRRIRIKFTTTPLSLEETISYIRYQMKNAGVTKQIFSDEAISGIYDYSKGIISSVNFICYMALIKAGTDSKEIVDPGLIEIIRRQDK